MPVGTSGTVEPSQGAEDSQRLAVGHLVSPKILVSLGSQSPEIRTLALQLVDWVGMERLRRGAGLVSGGRIGIDSVVDVEGRGWMSWWRF